MVKPKEIIETIDNAKPFNKKEIAENYRDLSINWEVFFNSADKDTNESNIINLSFGDPNEKVRSYLIFCRADLNTYPEFKSMEKGQKMLIKGKIDDIKIPYGIFLKNCVFDFIKKDVTSQNYHTPKEPLNNKIINPSFVVNNSQLHFGTGDNIGKDKIENNDKEESNKKWYKRPEVMVPIILTIVAIVIAFLSIPWLSNLIPALKIKQNDQTEIPTKLSETISPINILNIFSKLDSFNISLDRQNFLANYEDKEVSGTGYFNDISRFGETYYVYLNIGNNFVACSFNTNTANEIKDKLLLLNKGDRVSFSGIFTGNHLNGGSYWYVRDCK